MNGVVAAGLVVDYFPELKGRQLKREAVILLLDHVLLLVHLGSLVGHLRGQFEA